MKIYLLPKDGQFYKANLHSHSTLSDGNFTPEQVKKLYKDKGYSVYAFTEHRIYYDLRKELDDKDFITLPAYEAELAYNKKTTPFPAICEGSAPTIKEAEVIHLNMFAIDPDKVSSEVDVKDIYHDYSAENINELIRRGKEAGFFVEFNHPHWSLNSAELYNQLEGLDAIEMVTGAAYRSSGLDHVPHVYREFAWRNKRMGVLAGDDNHRAYHFFQAWTMIKAPELTHKAIMDAIIKGDCYTSTGPEIEELSVEDGVVHIKTSEAQGIYFSTAGRRKEVSLMADNNDVPVTEAKFNLKETDIFFHITVRDINGRPANTRIYYLDEFDFFNK